MPTTEIKMDVELLSKILNSIKPRNKYYTAGMKVLRPVLRKNKLGDKTYNRYATKWNKDVKSGLINENIGKSIKKDPNDGAFKWGQLVKQECWMYCRLAEQVDKEEFDEICKRRGFDRIMKKYLKDMIIHVGLGENLK